MLRVFVTSCCLTRHSRPSKRRKMMQIIANRMPFAILHALQASRAAPNLHTTLAAVQYTELCSHPRSLPSNHVII